MKALPALLLSVLAWLFPVLCTGAAEEKKAEPGLAELAADKRGASNFIREKVPHPEPGTTELQQKGYGLGVFISADGLALLNLSNLATANKPELLADNSSTELPLGTILGIFPEPELALVKFKYKPKLWVPLAAKEPETGEQIAIAGLSNFTARGDTATPVIGPVLAKRSTFGSNLREPRFRRIMSLGAGMDMRQRTSFTQGSWAVNAKGELVAVKAGVRVGQGQLMILLAPLGELAEQVEKMVKDPKPIPFPLPADKNPIDLALMDPAFHRWDTARQAGDEKAAMEQMRDLQKRYPDDPMVGLFAFGAMLTAEDKPVTKLDDLPKLEATAPAALKFYRLQARASFLAESQKDYAAAIREFTPALELCPKDFPEALTTLESLHRQANHADESEALLRQIHALEPENIALASALEMLLTRKGKLDEAQKFTDKVFELEKLYQAR